MNVYHHIVIMSILYLSCHAVPLLPRWIDKTFPLPVEGFTWHELTEMMLSPLLLCSVFALYQHLIKARNKQPAEFWYTLPFLVISCISQQGQGIHLAANTIHSTISPGNEYNRHAGLTQRLTYFLDEYLGHHLVFTGLALIFTLLIIQDKLAQNQKQARLPISMFWHVAVFMLGVLHGVAWFMAGVEGQTVQTVSLPVSVILTVDLLLSTVRRGGDGPVTRYFQVSGLISLGLLLWWGWRFNWSWPEFRVLGLGPFSTWLVQFRALVVKSLQ